MGDKQELVYVGFRSFNGKNDTSKVYYVLSFLTLPIVSNERGYCKSIDIFVNKDEYNYFIKNNNLLDTVEVSYEIYGDKVKYKLN